MLFTKLKNEKGISLVELLAALSLFAVVIALSSTVIVQMVNSEEKTSEQISLQQSTNVLMAELRSQYYELKSEGSDICFRKNKKIINTSKSVFKNGDRPLKASNGCIRNVDNKHSLFIHLTTNNSTGQNVTIKTTIVPKKNYVLVLEENLANFTIGDMDEACTFIGDTKFNNTILKNKQNTTCQNKYIIHGSAAFMGDLTLHNKVNITVEGNLYIYGNLTFKGSKGMICVRGDIITKGAESAKNVTTKRNAKSCFRSKDTEFMF